MFFTETEFGSAKHFFNNSFSLRERERGREREREREKERERELLFDEIPSITPTEKKPWTESEKTKH